MVVGLQCGYEVFFDGQNIMLHYGRVLFRVSDILYIYICVYSIHMNIIIVVMDKVLY